MYPPREAVKPVQRGDTSCLQAHLEESGSVPLLGEVGKPGTVAPFARPKYFGSASAVKQTSAAAARSY